MKPMRTYILCINMIFMCIAFYFPTLAAEQKAYSHNNNTSQTDMIAIICKHIHKIRTTQTKNITNIHVTLKNVYSDTIHDRIISIYNALKKQHKAIIVTLLGIGSVIAWKLLHHTDKNISLPETSYESDTKDTQLSDIHPDISSKPTIAKTNKHVPNLTQTSHSPHKHASNRHQLPLTQQSILETDTIDHGDTDNADTVENILSTNNTDITEITEHTDDTDNSDSTSNTTNIYRNNNAEFADDTDSIDITNNTENSTTIHDTDSTNSSDIAEITDSTDNTDHQSTLLMQLRQAAPQTDQNNRVTSQPDPEVQRHNLIYEHITPQNITIHDAQNAFELAIQAPKDTRIALLKAVFNKFGADSINMSTRIAGSPTALLHAASTQSEDLVELLLEHKAPADHSSQNHYSPLHYAAKNCNKQIVELLVHNRSIINEINQEIKGTGETPLELLILSQQSPDENIKIEIAEILRVAGADFTKKTRYLHKSLSQLALDNHQDTLAEYLQNHEHIARQKSGTQLHSTITSTHTLPDHSLLAPASMPSE